MVIRLVQGFGFTIPDHVSPKMIRECSVAYMSISGNEGPLCAPTHREILDVRITTR